MADDPPPAPSHGSGPPEEPTPGEVAQTWLAALLADGLGPLQQQMQTTQAVQAGALRVIYDDTSAPGDFAGALYGLATICRELQARVTGLSWIALDAISELAFRSGDTREAVLQRLAEPNIERD